MKRGNADFGVSFFINTGGVNITDNSSYNNSECIGQEKRYFLFDEV